MEQLQYDPRTKQLIKDSIIRFLYDPFHKQFTERLRALAIKNCILGGYGHKSFTYKGESYNYDHTPPPRKANRLVPQLIPVMEEIMREQAQVNNEEMPYTLGYINSVLNLSNDLQDYLRLLPAALHRPVKDWATTCPCRTRHVSEEQAQVIEQTNAQSINLIKQRMVRNLLI